MLPSCVSVEIQNLIILLTFKELCSSLSGMCLNCFKLDLQLYLGVDSFGSRCFQHREGRVEITTVGVLLQNTGQDSPGLPHHLSPLPPSSASVQSQLPLWPGEDQAAQEHYLLQPFMLVHCHHLDPMNRMEDFRAAWHAGGLIPSPGSEGGTDLTEWGCRFENHHNSWSPSRCSCVA